MTTLRYLLILMRAGILCGWAGTVAAATLALTQSQFSVDPIVAAVCIVISTMSGATTLAIRVNGLLAADAQKPLVKPWLFALAHMLGSWLAGIVAFLGGRINGSQAETVMLLVLLMSVGGASAIEKVAERYLPVIRPPEETP